MKYRRLKWVLLVLILILLVGCGSDQDENYSNADQVIQVQDITVDQQNDVLYWLDSSGEELVQVPYEMKKEGVLLQAQELIEMLQTSTDETKEYLSIFNKNVKIKNFAVDNKQIYIHFSEAYLEMDNWQEILVRVGLAKTLLQVNGIDYVSFYVNDLPLQDAAGNMVGTMNMDSFAEDMKVDNSVVAVSTIYLFYATKDGQSLTEEEKRIRSTTNKSKEKLVVEALMKEPSNSDLVKVIPDGTKLLSVSTLDGVCLVNFDETFQNQNYDIEEGVVIYSIVNSLCSLPNVNKVQIAVNGNTTGVYREKYKLADIYSRNLDFLLGAKTTEKGETP